MATKTTRLEAVNSILSAAGETPVASLSVNAGVNSTMADRILEEASRGIQSAGWRFNTQTISLPVVNGEIPIAENVIRVDTNDYGLTHLDVRGNKVFNLDTGTTTGFTSGLQNVEVVVLLDWEDLPEPARLYIMKTACRMYVDRMVSDPTVSRNVRQDEAMAVVALKRYEMASGNYRVFGQRALRVIDRGQPLDWIS